MPSSYPSWPVQVLKPLHNAYSTYSTFSFAFLLKSLNLWSSSRGVLLGGMSAEQLLKVITWFLLFILRLTFSFGLMNLYEDWHSGTTCSFMFPKLVDDGAPFLSWPFGFLPLHFRPCAICWFIYHAYFTASSAWHHWLAVLKKPRDVWDAMLNTFNILWKKHLCATQQQTSDLHQLGNPNRTNSGSNAHLPSYAPRQIVPSPPPPPVRLRGLYIGGLHPERHSYLQTFKLWLRGRVEPLQWCRCGRWLSSCFVSMEERAAGCPLGRVSAGALEAETSHLLPSHLSTFLTSFGYRMFYMIKIIKYNSAWKCSSINFKLH